MRDEGIATGNAAADEQGQSIMDSAKKKLDMLSPDWREEVYGLPQPKAQEKAQPKPEPNPDHEANPFEQPADELPVREGRVEQLYGHTATEPTALQRNWERLIDVLKLIKGPIPEIPTFPGMTPELGQV